MIRGSKVGTVVEVRPMKGRTLVGTVMHIATVGEAVRTLATAEGYVHVMPEEMFPTDEPDRTKPVEEVVPGDVVVLFNGVHRLVERVEMRRPMPSLPAHYRLTLRLPDGGIPRYFRWQDCRSGDRWFVVPAEA